MRVGLQAVKTERSTLGRVWSSCGLMAVLSQYVSSSAFWTRWRAKRKSAVFDSLDRRSHPLAALDARLSEHAQLYLLRSVN